MAAPTRSIEDRSYWATSDLCLNLVSFHRRPTFTIIKDMYLAWEINVFAESHELTRVRLNNILYIYIAHGCVIKVMSK